MEALHLTPLSTLDDALSALLRARDEALSEDDGGAPAPNGREQNKARRRAGTWKPGHLPPRGQLAVWAVQRGVDSEARCVGVGKKSGRSRLEDLGVLPCGVGPDAKLPELYLASAATPRRACCGFRSGRRCRDGACCERLWESLPERWQEKLKPYVAQWRFYMLALRWGIGWMWEDRHAMFHEAKNLVTPARVTGTPPPCKAREVSDELRPFLYAFFVVLSYFLWSVLRTLAFGCSASTTDLALAS